MRQPTNLTIPDEHELSHFANLISEQTKQQSSDYENLLGLSKENYLSKLDYHGITLLAQANNRLPADLEQIVAQRRAMMVANSVLKQNALIELFDAFSAAGLSSVLFKGGALAHTIYPQPWLRPRTDTDVLIRPQDLEQFSVIFEQVGYQKQFAIEGKYVSYQTTFSKALAGDSVMDIDLHWRINNRQSLAKAYDLDSLSLDGQTLSQLPANILVPNHTDSLLISSLHRLGHHHNEERLAWLYDIHLLASALSDDQWQTLAKKATSKKICAITLDALLNCQRWLGTAIPEPVINSLKNKQDEPSAVFLKRNLPEWRYFVADMKAMPTVSAKFGLLRENILPSPDYVRQQMGTESAMLAYTKRFIRGIKRVFSA